MHSRRGQALQQMGRRQTCRASAGGQANMFIGSLRADDLNFGIVVARFNELVTKPLLEGVLEGIERHGGQRADVDVRMPHSYGMHARACMHENTSVHAHLMWQC